MWRKLLGYGQRTPSEPPENPPQLQLQPPQPDPTPLEARVSQLTAELASLRLEWSETLDKLGRWASRQSARDRRRVDRDLDQLGQEGPEAHEDAPGTTNGASLDTGSLTDRVAVKAALRRKLRGG